MNAYMGIIWGQSKNYLLQSFYSDPNYFVFMTKVHFQLHL